SSFAPCPRGSGRWERVLYPGAGGLRLHAWLVPRHGGAVLLPPWRGPRLLDAPSPPGSSPTVPHAASLCSACFSNCSISAFSRLLSLFLYPYLIALCREAFAPIFVPSVDRFPSLTMPISPARRSTSRNRGRNAPRWILRKSLIVRKSGGSIPTMARKAKLRSQAAAILRLEQTPTE